MRCSITGLGLAALLCVPSPLPAQQGGRASEAAGAATVAAITASATVQSVDVAQRSVSLRRDSGEVVELRVGDEVRNLDQVEPGDRVTVTYAVGLVVALSPPGAPPVRVEDVEVARAAPGQRPGGVARRMVAVTATVVAVDAQARRVTLAGPRQTVTLAVADDIDLARVEVGDSVGAVYEESLAIRVEPAAE